MKCAKIGKTAGKSCKIHVGIDFTVQREIDKNTNQLRLYNVKFEKLKTLISTAEDVDGERYKKLIELRNKLDAEIQRVAALIDKLQTKVVIDERAAVTVTGEISQGTLIEICQVALFIDKPLRRATLRFDKSLGKIVQVA
jgi:SMC interacting uncharacterized protein involved in chromosome segregation